MKLKNSNFNVPSNGKTLKTIASFSLTNILIAARRSWDTVFPVLDPGVVMHDWLSHRMITVLRRFIRT